MTQVAALDTRTLAHTHNHTHWEHFAWGKEEKLAKANASWPLEDSSYKNHLGSSRLRPYPANLLCPRLRSLYPVAQKEKPTTPARNPGEISKRRQV